MMFSGKGLKFLVQRCGLDSVSTVRFFFLNFFFKGRNVTGAVLCFQNSL